MEEKKPIAERLRESLNIINHVKTFNEAAPVGEGTDGKKLFCPKDTIRFIADEIERYYIPRPRDKDGKPWDIDASCIVNGEECKIAGFDGDGNINVEDGDSNTFFWIGEGYVKRPTPKVLDPNGVEFAKDDIVYGKSGIEYKVLLLTPNAPHPITALRTDGTPGYCVLDADDLAHEKPVLDADGGEIKPGETLYGRGRQHHTYTVQKVPDINEELGERFCVRCYDANDDEVVWVDPLNVSHNPIVLDADGVEIKVGDTVYHIKDGACDNVISLETDEYGQPMANCLSFEAHAKHVTHEKPVFDAEGVRIRKGDTVWSVRTGEKFSVEGLPEDSRDNLLLVGEVRGIANISTTWYAPHEVTHREPDSLEKLRDYVREQEEQEFSGARDVYHKIGDRLTALIERGA